MKQKLDILFILSLFFHHQILIQGNWVKLKDLLVIPKMVEVDGLKDSIEWKW
jgi:hypothetical protein